MIADDQVLVKVVVVIVTSPGTLHLRRRDTLFSLLLVYADLGSLQRKQIPKIRVDCGCVGGSRSHSDFVAENCPKIALNQGPRL